jgi:hypothetical protein
MLSRPTETNASQAGSSASKNLARVRALLQDFEGYTRRCAGVPLRNVTAPRREEDSNRNSSLCGSLVDISTKDRGLLSGTTMAVS